MDQEGERDLGTALARLGRNPRWRPPPGGAVHKLQLAEARKLLPVLTLAGGLARQDTLGEAPRGTNQHFSGQRPRPTRPDLFPGHWCWLPCSPTLTESYEGLSPLLVKLVLSKPTPHCPNCGPLPMLVPVSAFRLQSLCTKLLLRLQGPAQMSPPSPGVGVPCH